MSFQWFDLGRRGTLPRLYEPFAGYEILETPQPTSCLRGDLFDGIPGRIDLRDRGDIL